MRLLFSFIQRYAKKLETVNTVHVHERRELAYHSSRMHPMTHLILTSTSQSVYKN